VLAVAVWTNSFSSGSPPVQQLYTYRKQDSASYTALFVVVPAWRPILPGQTRPGRSASVILTSPTLRATEVRITTAPLRRVGWRRKSNPKS
jgi:hypothetical protein